MSKYIGAIDQGTTSTRFILFDKNSNPVSSSQIEHRQLYPQPGFVEHNAAEIWKNTKQVIADTLEKTKVKAADIAAIGITNQRETTVVWNKQNGEPLTNAVVWQDARTGKICRQLKQEIGQDFFSDKTGLPLATYFSAPKIKWLFQNDPKIKKAADSGKLMIGTIDSWLIWNLTGGENGGNHITDVTNASRTMLMDLQDLKWHQELLTIFDIKEEFLPAIRPSIDSSYYGYTRIPDVFPAEIPICGNLGDQQAALLGQNCLKQGDAKNTYGTGCFLLMNTGNEIVKSSHGLLTTVACQFKDKPATYALEGSVAIAGSLVQWFRDNFGLITSSEKIEHLAKTVKDNGGVYFVPAFSGLFAPYWNSDARGILVGLTHYINKGHMARAILEATAFQSKEVFEAMMKDARLTLSSLKVDGGMTANELLMQFQADILDVEVIRPQVTETTALGAAYAAGLAVGFWKNTDSLANHWKIDKSWQPNMKNEVRKQHYSLWKKAVNRSKDWLE